MSNYLPQMIVLALMFTGLGMDIANHGKRRSKENAWATLVAVIIQLSLYYWGGFFSHMFVH